MSNALTTLFMVLYSMIDNAMLPIHNRKLYVMI